MPTGIKLCGLTRSEDVTAAAAHGADALGFVFAPGSPRVLTPDQAAALTAPLTAKPLRVGVFQDQDIDFIRMCSNVCGLHVVQLHGTESPDMARALAPLRVWKSWILRGPGDLQAARQYPAEAIVVDGECGGRSGGTGCRADWDLAAQLAARRDVVLAGGLSAGNVGTAIRQVRPAWVDVSSGVEEAPGIKSTLRMRVFIIAARLGQEGYHDR